MKSLELEVGAVQVDASIVAEGLGLPPALLREGMRTGKIRGISERGVGEHEGRFRLTFFLQRRRFRLVFDSNGSIIQRTTLDLGNRGGFASSSP
jgi:hypothetical protein